MKWLLLALFPLSASAQTFDVDFNAFYEHVTGVIQLTPGTSGPVVASEITSWSLASDGPIAFSLSGNGANCYTSCGLTVSNGQLFVSSDPGNVTFASNTGSTSIASGSSPTFSAPLGGGRGDFGISMAAGAIASDPPPSTFAVFTTENHTGGGGALELTLLLSVMGISRAKRP